MKIIFCSSRTAIFAILALALSACEINTVARTAVDSLKQGETYVVIVVGNSRASNADYTNVSASRVLFDRVSDRKCFQHDTFYLTYRDFLSNNLVAFKVPAGRYVARDTMHSPSLPDEKVISFVVRPGVANVVGSISLNGQQLTLSSIRKVKLPRNVTSVEAPVTLVPYPNSFTCTP